MLTFLIVFVLCGCSTGVVSTGPDTYMISKSVSGFGSTYGAKAKIFNEANHWCAKRGLVMIPISTDVQEPVMAQHLGHAELIFKAVKPDSAEVKNPPPLKETKSKS